MFANKHIIPVISSADVNNMTAFLTLDELGRPGTPTLHEPIQTHVGEAYFIIRNRARVMKQCDAWSACRFLQIRGGQRATKRQKGIGQHKYREYLFSREQSNDFILTSFVNDSKSVHRKTV